MIQITHEEIDIQTVIDSVASPEAGAVVLFLGTTRGLTDQRRTDHLEYECYREMALHRLEALERQARRQWMLQGCSLVHRMGRLEVGQASVAVAVSAPHRQEAFEAAKWLIDTLKESVPIWKKEHWSDGTSQWVHPGMTTPRDSNGWPS